MGFLRKSKVEELKIQSSKFQLQNEEAADFLGEIENGNLAAQIPKSLSKGKLSEALISIKKYLNKVSEEEKKRQWLSEGLNKFSDILRNSNSKDLVDLADEVISNLVKYINANQGAIFLLEGENKDEQYLKMLSCYAYSRKKFLDKKIDLSEGLAGQCILGNEMIYLKEVPQDFVQITSGLGEARPNAILLMPLSIHDSIFGVLELATFHEFSESVIDFVDKLSQNIAASIKNVRDNERTLELLKSSQQQTEELRAQEEEMRQNMEELEATQEEMARKSNELSTAMAEMEGVLAGINATMATIEFEPDGTIVTANQNFLRSVGYSLEEIRGKHHKIFVPDESINSEDYMMFWERLASGKSESGIFKRKNSKGESVWLNAIYNPILDGTGKVVKVVKFANDITSQQEMIAESEDLLEGINATMSTIEFTPEGIVTSANDNFLNIMGYDLEDIKGKHHRIFIPDDILNSDDYQTFWERLAGGEKVSGEFKRITSKGEVVWLKAIYNPMKNANGNIVKVLKLATDVTKLYNAGKVLT